MKQPTDPSLRKLRIGMLASNVIRIPPTPPNRYVPAGWSGAPELVAHLLTEELVRRGHDVTLFASGNSKTTAELVSTAALSSYEDPNVGIAKHREAELMLIEKAYALAEKGAFDIIHSHFDVRSAPLAARAQTPTISTLHSPLAGSLKNKLEPYKQTQYYASISDNQRKGMPDLRYAVTAYNGIETEKIPFSSKKEDYLIFIGRFVEAKGPIEAIEVAKRTGLKLLLLGSPKEGDPYWEEKIKPQIDNTQIIYKGFLPREEVFAYLSRAKAFIFPLQWEEPFGLVAAEAMATGTPVITFDRGSMSEIVEDGKTGFICKDLTDMVRAVGEIGRIKPEDCRGRVENLFTVKKVVDRYEKAYYAILAEHAKSTA